MRRANEVPTTTLVRAIVMAIDSLSSRVTRPERRTRGVQIRLERRKSRNNFDEAGGCVSFEVTRTAARTLLSSPSPPPSFSLSRSREKDIVARRRRRRMHLPTVQTDWRRILLRVTAALPVHLTVAAGPKSLFRRENRR